MNEEYARIKVSVKITGQENYTEITIPGLSEKEFFNLLRHEERRTDLFNMALGHLATALEEKKIIPIVLEIGERRLIYFSGVYDVIGDDACQITMYTDMYPEGIKLGETAKGAFRLEGKAISLSAGTLLSCEHGD